MSEILTTLAFKCLQRWIWILQRLRGMNTSKRASMFISLVILFLKPTLLLFKDLSLQSSLNVTDIINHRYLHINYRLNTEFDVSKCETLTKTRIKFSLLGNRFQVRVCRIFGCVILLLLFFLFCSVLNYCADRKQSMHKKSTRKRLQCRLDIFGSILG